MTTTIDWNRSSGDETSCRTCQKCNYARNFFDVSWSSESVCRFAVLEELCISCVVHSTALVDVCNDNA